MFDLILIALSLTSRTSEDLCNIKGDMHRWQENNSPQRLQRCLMCTAADETPQHESEARAVPLPLSCWKTAMRSCFEWSASHPLLMCCQPMYYNCNLNCFCFPPSFLCPEWPSWPWSIVGPRRTVPSRNSKNASSDVPHQAWKGWKYHLCNDLFCHRSAAPLTFIFELLCVVCIPLNCLQSFFLRRTITHK